MKTGALTENIYLLTWLFFFFFKRNILFFYPYDPVWYPIKKNKNKQMIPDSSWAVPWDLLDTKSRPFFFSFFFRSPENGSISHLFAVYWKITSWNCQLPMIFGWSQKQGGHEAIPGDGKTKGEILWHHKGQIYRIVSFSVHTFWNL